MSEEQERMVSAAGVDGIATRFLRRVSSHYFRHDPVVRFLVPAEVWGAIAYETDFGTAPGSRCRDEIELQCPSGFTPVSADPSLVRESVGEAVRSSGKKVLLDFEAVVP